jgi:hypothetical protein
LDERSQAILGAEPDVAPRPFIAQSGVCSNVHRAAAVL